MRLFVAILLSPAVERALLETQAALGRQGRGAFPQREDLHLTLAFLGETDRAEDAVAALEDACAGGPFPLAVEGLGRFGGLWWAGVAEDPRLEQLALGVQEALRRRGFAVEERPWRPHITLVRRWRGPEPAAAVPRTAMEVRRVSLLRSDPAGRPRYTEVFGVDL